MPSEPKTFNPFPHDWHSTDYVSGWITHDVARDLDRRPLLRQMLSFAPFPRESELEVLDLGAGYGVVTEEVLQAFPAAHVTLQDYSQPMLDQARQRLAARSKQLSFVLCDLTDSSWPQAVGGPFDLAVSAIALHNLRDPEKIFACYRPIQDLLKPGGFFLNCDRFVEGVEPHLTELREAGFDRVECAWQQAPRAIVVAGRIDH
jgi:ubiquinone/menaquinone biosynthesis C-methylase UbiE